MLSNEQFVKNSLELNLFFLRIMKEHLIFVSAFLMPKDAYLINDIDTLKCNLEKLLGNTIMLSRGVISPVVDETGDIVTKYTLKAEDTTEFYTGLTIDTKFTKAELALPKFNAMETTKGLTEKVFSLNQKIMDVMNSVIKIKSVLKENVFKCKMFIGLYPALTEHVLEEALFYFSMLAKLQKRVDIDINQEIVKQESFWNEIMAEHSKFIRGMLDPTEEVLIEMADKFGDEFDVLNKRALKLFDDMSKLKEVTKDSLKATTKLRDFKIQGTEGILSCKVKSIILPLLSDHVLREANHYLKALKSLDTNNKARR
ncbi:hypothetical protein JOC70_001436 [Clostridium pascui]|uniref:DUF2935 domain-containing protein n=1 Tax=Clostridium pascui TaxID=46609 RepID=UPI0019560913|nr:DUF2935 domain-containing protein [Clostridium pascui]MBM7869966.1 hypothetical protein [Clostridium pascui]